MSTPITTIDELLAELLALITTAADETDPTDPLREDLTEVALTLTELLDTPNPSPKVQATHAPPPAVYLQLAEQRLDDLPPDQRPMWLLPLRTELAILRRRAARA